MDESKYLNFRKLNEKETELYIYGEVRKKDWIDNWLGTGKDVTEAFTLKDALACVDTPNLTVRINSYGGDVAEGLTIYSLLSTFKGKIKTIVDGFACSAASVIFMAGQERIVPENGLLMIHNAWTEAKGDSNKMKKVAEDLEKITQPSLNIYTKKTKLTEQEIKEKMDREEWITSEEAFEWGFSTSKEREEKYMQALEADFVHDLVMKNKELQKELQESKKEPIDINQIADIIKENIKQAITELDKEIDKEFFEGKQKSKPVGLLNNSNNNQIKRDSWEFF